MSLPLLSFARVAVRDLFGGSGSSAGVPAERQAAAAAWLERAQDATPDDGVSAGFALKGGWRASSIESSGSIAITFFDVARAWNAPRFEERAVRIAEWLGKVQQGDGSFPGTQPAGRRGGVLATGQNLLALVRAFEETRNEPYLRHARLAGDWLVQVAGGEGRWTSNTRDDRPHVENALAAWALLELERVDAGSEYANAGWKRVARAELGGTVARQRPSGCFDDGEPDAAPTTHAIAQALRGLLESWRLEGDPSWLAAARRGAAAARERLREDGFLPGRLGADGEPAARSACLSGTAQMALLWARLHGNVERAGDRASRDAAVRALRNVMRTQDLATTDLDVRGAIKGSQPVWGQYEPYAYPSWATRLFLDALVLCEEWLA